MAKYKLFNTPAEFEAKEVELKTLLSIPDSVGTSNYAEAVMVENTDHADYGMFVLQVLTEGKWKCDQHFDSAELVDFDPTWVSRVAE